MKTCTKCGQTLSLDEFTMTSRGRKPSCKACERARVRQWSAENPEKEREKAARRRMRGGGATIDVSIRQRLFESQNGRCFYTNAVLDIATAHIDHKVPISRGGTNDFTNLVLCTREANLLKHNKTAEEFLEWIAKTGVFKSPP